MTVIAGLIHNGRVHLAGDSATAAGWDLTLKAAGKVFRNGPYVFGCAGSARAPQLLRYAFEPPAPTSRLRKFMATTFIDAVRGCLKDGGHAKKNSDQEDADTTFIVGVNGRLFVVHADYQVHEDVEPYMAIGCGDNQALGALYATAETAMKPRERLRIALSAAERFSSGVRRPFTFVATRRPAPGDAKYPS